MKENKSFEFIQEIYSEFNKRMFFYVSKGMTWNDISKLPKPVIKKRKIGYRLSRGLYIVQKSVLGKKKVEFSSRSEEEVIKYIENSLTKNNQ